MTFSEYALGLSPFISQGEPKDIYFVEIVGNFIKDATMDACSVLNLGPDVKRKYINGNRTIPIKAAQYLYDYRDKDKFSTWIWERMDYSDSYNAVVEWLKSNNIECDDPANCCADLLEQIILDIINRNSSSITAQETVIDLQLINDIEEKIKSLPKPVDIPIPEVTTNDEETYIAELYSAYGDAEGIDNFSAITLSDYPDYEEDLADRRIDFYSAEAVRRGVLELQSDRLKGQFDILKDETLNNVKDTAKRRHSNGYECMLAVMEQAIVAPMPNYILSSSPYWMSGKIKKGVCHHLVNDGKLKWTRRKRND